MANYFNILFGCVKVINGKAVITQGMEELAPVTVLCCLHTLPHLTVTNPTLSALGTTCQQYVRAFPPETDFSTLPFSHTLYPIHVILQQNIWPVLHWTPQWDYKPSRNEHAIVAPALTTIAWFVHQRYGGLGAHQWLLLFVLRPLSQSPLPSTSVIANCLLIIAIELGCGPSDTTTLDKRYAHT